MKRYWLLGAIALAAVVFALPLAIKAEGGWSTSPQMLFVIVHRFVGYYLTTLCLIALFVGLFIKWLQPLEKPRI